MTNKSLSQQLCEVCGIEPKYKCKNVPCLNFMADSGICTLKDGFTKCNPEICEDDYTPDTNHRNWKEADAVYPDFENNNFSKLFKLITTAEGFSFSTGLYYLPQIPSHRQMSCLSTPEGEYASECTDPIKAFLACVFKCAVKEKDTAIYIKNQQWEV